MNENENKKDIEELVKNTPKYPERAAESTSDKPDAEGVYAGPQMPVAMVTYAGPDMMRHGFGVSLQRAFQQLQKPKQAENSYSGSKVFCDMCGSANSEKAKYCSECGNPLKKN